MRKKVSRPKPSAPAKPAAKKKTGPKPAARKPVAAARGRGSARSHTQGPVVTSEELQALYDRLRETQETLDAIRNGEVDAVVMTGAGGNKIYSLASAEQPYRIYVERMQEGAVTVSPDGVILYCNQRFADMLKMPLERVISSDLRACLPEGSWEGIAAIFGSGDEVMKHESLLLRAGNSPLPVNFTASRLPLDEQHQVACLVVTDLTVQKQHEELRLAKEVAERASENKNSFLAALSHELRTPLNPALMTAVALEQDPALDDRVRESLGMIRRNIELEARLIDDLLDLTRVEQGKLELHIGTLDVHTILRQAVDICRSDIESKKQKLTLELGAGQTVTEGDGVRLQQAMWNLIRNASKFTPEGGAISVRTWHPSHSRIAVSVKDTGIGFRSDGASRLFMAFEQGGRDITRRFGGLGLGLTISRSILHSHSGSIQAESAGEGMGATFTMEFPLRIPLAAKPGSKKAPEPKAPAPAQRMRILFVEDHEDTRKSMEFLLKAAGYAVTSAGTAAEALAHAASETFDLVITDLGLPDTSGLDLMKELRDKYGLRGIATTGYGMKEDIEQTRDAGFLHHLTKPIRMATLKQLVVEMGPVERKG